MCKASFSVGFLIPHKGKTIVVMGVTSIVPNLGGVLLFTEDRRNYQIESWEMTEACLGNMFIDYVLGEDEFADMGYEVIDHTEH